jgi:hypothetical protein
VEAVPAGHVLEFLSDNGGAYIAHDTRRIVPGVNYLEPRIDSSLLLPVLTRCLT